MKKIFLVGILFIGLSGCHKDQPANTDVEDTVCSDERAMAEGIASGIAGFAGCADASAIQTDVMGVLEKVHTCTKSETARETLRKKYAAGEKADATKDKGILGNILCPPASTALVNFMAGKLPSAWKCDGGKAGELAASQLTKFCVASVPL